MAFDEMGKVTGTDPTAWSEPDLEITGLLNFDTGG